MTRSILIVFSWLIVTFQLGHTQSNCLLPIGSWEMYLPYNEVVSITQSETKTYWASSLSIVAEDHTDGSLTFFDRSTGLNQVGIRFIKYHAPTQTLIVVYDDSFIDLVQGDDVRRFAEINEKNISGDKFIYDISFDGNIAYLSCGFGIVGYDMDLDEIRFTTFTDRVVFGAKAIDNQLFGSMEDGLYAIDKNHFFIHDFLKWDRLGLADGLPDDYSSTYLNALGDKLYFGLDGRLVAYSLTTQVVDSLFEMDNHQLNSINDEGEGLVAAFDCRLPNDDPCSGRIVYISPEGDLKTYAYPNVHRPMFGVERDGAIRIADEWRPYGLLYIDGGYEERVLNVNSPYSKGAFGMQVHQGNLYVASGSWDATKEAAHCVPDGLFKLDTDCQWSYINRSNADLPDAECNFMETAIHPESEKIYVATFHKGVLEFDGDQIKKYSLGNSSLQNNIGYDSSLEAVHVTSLEFDTDNNLWMTNDNVPSPLVVLKNDGSWDKFDFPEGQLRMHRMIIDDYGYKWIVLNHVGVMVFDSGESINNKNDDQYHIYTPGNSELESNGVNCLAKDLDGAIWVGTNEGVVTFGCGTTVFDAENRCSGTKRIASLNGFNAYLLNDEVVNAIAIDPANRKWFGTSNGLFVMSPSGEEEIYRFSMDNSPLPSNIITNIAIDEESGKVYIGTQNGIVAYQAGATKGLKVNQSDAYAYPNPYLPEYTEPIAIKGLAHNANVKITDMEGKLVYETESLGGQAIWDGTDYNGRKVVSGVYLVFSTAEAEFSKPDVLVTKIIVLD